MKTEGSKKRAGGAAALLAVFLFTPAAAMASEGTAMTVATYTAAAIGLVVAAALAASAGLALALRAGLVRSEEHLHLRRQIRVAFGATFLMAALTPYVALHFSMANLVPFLAVGGVIIAAWGWGATGLETSDQH